jgi:hypothetical protein
MIETWGRFVIAGLALACMACGGRLSAGNAGGDDDPGVPSAPPEVGTAACDMQPEDAGPHGVCVICSDGQWHCDGLVVAVCPSGIQQGAPCDWPPTEDIVGECLTSCQKGPGLVAWACCDENGPCPDLGGSSSAPTGATWMGNLAGSDPCP